MSELFSPLELRSLKLRNRILLSPMCQYSCRDGIPGSWHHIHYSTRAVGGVAMILIEATSVVPEGRISPFDCGLWTDEQAAAFKPIVEVISAQGVVPAIQLGHAGRKASTEAPWNGRSYVSSDGGGWQPVAPSPITFSPGMPVPTELSSADLEQLLTAFESAAQRAQRVGFKAVELHMAHGYLLHQFLSPLSNRRGDEFGGSLENRMRFPLLVAEKVRSVWPDELPLLVRISATDWVEGGWDVPQSIELAKQLKAIGVDLLDCSSGGLVADAEIPAAPGFQVPFAAEIRVQVGFKTGAVGLITDAHQAEKIIATGQADAVLLGRELLRNPYWPLQAAKELGVDIPWPNQYARAKI